MCGVSATLNCMASIVNSLLLTRDYVWLALAGNSHVRARMRVRGTGSCREWNTRLAGSAAG